MLPVKLAALFRACAHGQHSHYVRAGKNLLTPANLVRGASSWSFRSLCPARTFSGCREAPSFSYQSLSQPERLCLDWKVGLVCFACPLPFSTAFSPHCYILISQECRSLLDSSVTASIPECFPVFFSESAHSIATHSL